MGSARSHTLLVFGDGVESVLSTCDMSMLLQRLHLERSGTELRLWNLAHAKAHAIRYQQSRLDISDEMDLVGDKSRLDADDAKDRRLSRDQGIDGVLKAHNLDAFVTPGSSGARIAATAGYPIVAVPFGMVPNAPAAPFPAGFIAKPAPFGIGFVGAQCSEPKLIALAYAFEQATRKRVAPSATP